MAGDEWDPDDVLVVIGHPFGDVEMPLTTWIAPGPGPRHGIRPRSARSRSTGEPLPLTAIPLAYRNNREARALIAAGRITPPWPGTEHTEISGPRAFDKSMGDTAKLAAEERWDDFHTASDQAGNDDDIGPVLCELLDSNANPPNPGHIVVVLARLRYAAAGETLERLLGRFVYADNDLDNAHRCLRAIRAVGRVEMLPLIAWSDWPDPIPQWAAAEFPAWRP